MTCDDAAPREHLFSSKFGCPVCSYSLSELEPRLFSFNSPVGACPSCGGLGQVTVFDAQRVVAFPSPEPGLGRGQGLGPAQCLHLLDAGKRGQALRLRHRHALRSAAGEGAAGAAARLGRGGHRLRLRGAGRQGQGARRSSARTPSKASCPTWSGATARPIRRRCARTWRATRRPSPARIAAARGCGARRATSSCSRTPTEPGEPIYRVEHQTLAECLAYFEGLQLQGAKAEIADKIVREIRSRLKFLNDVGLNYLSLDRSADTLSGGEAQRIRLASQIGSGLTGVMYVLDEPSHRPAPARQRAPDRHAASGCATWATRCWWWSTTRT